MKKGAFENLGEGEIVKEIDPLEAAAGEVLEIVRDDFAAKRFTEAEGYACLKSIHEKNRSIPMTKTEFGNILAMLREEGTLGFDEATETYYEREAA